MTWPISRRRLATWFANGAIGIATAWLMLLFLNEFLLSSRIGRSGAGFLVGACLCAIGFALDLKRRVNFALAIASFGCSLYIVEVALFLKNREVIEGLGPSSVVDSLRRQGIDAYPMAPPALHIESDGVRAGKRRIFPLSGIAGKTTVFCREAGPYIMYKSDRYGFNNPDEILGSIPDVVVIGDSFAHGACVERDADVAGSLRRLGWNVLNLGYSGDGPLLELATLQEYAAPFRPKTVVWLYFEGNDLQDLERERHSPTLRKYLGNGFSQALMSRQVEITSLLQDIMLKVHISRPLLIRVLDSRTGVVLRLLNLRYLAKTTLWRFPMFGGITYSEVDIAILDTLAETIAHARRTVNSWGGKFYFVYLPDSLRYQHGIDQGRLHMRSAVLTAMRSMQVSVVDFNETVRTLNDPAAIYPYLGAHFSATGYALLARTIDETLKRAAMD